MTPVSAAAAHVAGLARYTASSAVPLRPLKLRLNARSETAPVGGACPNPTHGPHADSSTRAPAAIKSASAPFCASKV